MRKSRLGRIKVKAEEPPKKVSEKKEKPVYIDLAEKRELTISDGVKLVFSVSKAQEGNPHLDIRTYIDSESYKGPTKKGINFDIESLEEFIQILEIMNEELDSKGF